MPNHVHALFKVNTIPLSIIVADLKEYTAREANKKLGRRGQFWADDYWDTFMRNAEHELKTRRYIENNPTKAYLVRDPKDWPWSSARFRDDHRRLAETSSSNPGFRGGPRRDGFLPSGTAWIGTETRGLEKLRIRSRRAQCRSGPRTVPVRSGLSGLKTSVFAKSAPPCPRTADGDRPRSELAGGTPALLYKSPRNCNSHNTTNL